MPVIRPEAFYIDTPPPRIMGSEMEYTPSPAAMESNELLDAWRKDRYALLGQFSQNGARFYVDCFACEVTTPEVTSAQDIALYEIAGERLILDSVERVAVRHTQPVRLFRRTGIETAGQKGEKVMKTSGYHANFSAARKLELPDFAPVLAAHIASSTVLFGEGALIDDGQTLILSQKEPDIGTVVGIKRTAAKEKPMILDPESAELRREVRVEDWQRIEVRAFDASINPYVTWLQFGTTSLVLRLAEHRQVPDDILLQDPLVAFRAVSRDPGLGTFIEADNRKVHPLDVQQGLAEAALKLAEKIHLSAEEKDIAEQWLGIVDAAKADADALENIAPWKLKQTIFKNAHARGKGAYELRQIDTKSEEVSACGLTGVLKERFDPMLTFSQDEVDTAKANPPKDTRAFSRGNFVKEYFRNHGATVSGWAQCNYPSSIGVHRIVGNPYDVHGFEL